MKTATIFLTILMTLFGSFILADEIEPSYDSAVVDGNYREWDLSNDFAVEMHKAWRDGSDGKAVKAVLANAYLRYDCDAEQMYVLVLAEKNYPLQVDLRGNNTYVKLNGAKMVSSRDNGDFSWVGVGFDGVGQDLVGKSLLCVNDDRVDSTQFQGLQAGLFQIFMKLSDVDGQGNDFRIILVLNPLEHHRSVEPAGVEQNTARELALVRFMRSNFLVARIRLHGGGTRKVVFSLPITGIRSKH